jgi:hypothetical protein
MCTRALTDRSSKSRSWSWSGCSGRRRARISAASTARSRSPAPAAASPARIASASARRSAGSLSVHAPITWAYDSDTPSPAMPANSSGCRAARRTHAACTFAAPG